MEVSTISLIPLDRVTLLILFFYLPLLRGNQRDRDRERAQARNGGGKSKQGKNDGLTPEQRRERDAKALQEKAAKKAGQDAGGNNAVLNPCLVSLFRIVIFGNDIVFSSLSYCLSG
ncbi:hypothetical protein RJT34_15984 [Clitoria ternatea]|uniref:Small EDRK-rich factor-like N-terminal domain-containing protein n=1 Tax=Clitoria ternatea TaxID=43366 RepID=A0AAN9J6L2_CLITE